MKLRMSNPYFSMLATAWKYARDQRKRFVLIYSLFFMSNLVHATLPIFWGIFINLLQEQKMNLFHVALMYAGLKIFVNLVEWGFHGNARVMERELAFHLSKNYLQEMYNKALHLPMKWHQDNHSGATINRIRKGYEALKRFFQGGFRYMETTLRLVFSLIAMVYFSPLFGGVAVILGIGIIWIILIFDKPFIAAHQETNEKEHVVSSTLFDSLSNIVTVITLRLEKRMEAGLLKRVDDVFSPFRRKIVINEWKWFVVDMCVVTLSGIILAGYVYQEYKPGEVFLIGGLVTLVNYVSRFTSVFHNVAYLYTEVVTHDTDVKAAQKVIDAYKEHHLPDTSLGMPEHWKTIRLDQVSFTHNHALVNGKARPTLNKVSIQIEKGKRIAFIGESGSGKSTLLAILRGLYEVEESSKLLIDGQRDSWNRIANTVTLFPQEPEIFENTIEYNITLGLPFEKEEVNRVCKTACFEKVIEQLPKGLESSIKEKGVNLSGGQKQRLALARGILAAQESDIILMDEPTSSVDPKTEMEIYDELFTEFSDKAIISSLHRLHLLSKFDYVYILDQGNLVDEGTFEELKANSLIFQELWRHQEEISRQTTVYSRQ